LCTSEKAVSLAAAVGGHALRLAELETFRPEEGMILANATSLGMYPNVDSTPIPKVSCSCMHHVIFQNSILGSSITTFRINLGILSCYI
jgi:3-dehydroquinate dehydratase/shikimate dehydrogenase